MVGFQWTHNKTGTQGKLHICSSLQLATGNRLYLKKEASSSKAYHTARQPNMEQSLAQKFSGRKWRGSTIKELPSSLPVAKFESGEVEMTMNLDSPSLLEKT